jgi:preprotein translocase subunit SecA
MISLFNALRIPDGEQIEHKMLSKAIENAQKKIENNNFGIRKNLLEYDQVNNDQREIIYEERRRVLDGENMRGVVMNMLNNKVENIVDKCISDELEPSEWNLAELNEMLLPIVPMEPVTDVSDIKRKDELTHMLKEKAVKLYEAKEAEFPSQEQMREIERVILLKVIDKKWMEHIDDMDQLRQGIGLQSYGNRNPVIEYKMAGFDMFDEMTAAIEEDTVKLLMHVRIEQKIEREEVAKVTGTNKDDSLAKAPVRRENKKIQRNDPCPCGSGQKYKNCCGRNA